MTPEYLLIYPANATPFTPQSRLYLWEIQDWKLEDFSNPDYHVVTIAPYGGAFSVDWLEWFWIYDPAANECYVLNEVRINTRHRVEIDGQVNRALKLTANARNTRAFEPERLRGKIMDYYPQAVGMSMCLPMAYEGEDCLERRA